MPPKPSGGHPPRKVPPKPAAKTPPAWNAAKPKLMAQATGVPPLPRPCYAPGTKGHPASSPGLDVLAYKRILGRIGAWPWTPDAYNRVYSSGFARGRPNTAYLGVKGVQQWAGLQATGSLGLKTYQFLTRVVVPKGRPNEGQRAMDAYAMSLLRQAHEAFKPPAPTPPPDKPSSRELALGHMRKRVGYTENPAGSNCDRRVDGIRTAQDHCAGGGTWLRYQPWCGSWCYYAIESAGVPGIGSWMASVAMIEDYARQQAKCFRRWSGTRDGVKPGDLVVIGGRGVHVEMVRGFDGSNVLTFGGNTSSGPGGSQSNGGGAFMRVRYPSEVHGYALVKFPDD
jgi:hypothetical protein